MNKKVVERSRIVERRVFGDDDFVADEFAGFAAPQTRYVLFE